MSGAGKIAQLQKMGLSRNVGLKRTGSQKCTGLGSIPTPFHSKTHFLSAPSYSLSSTKTLEQKRLDEPSFWLLTEAVGLTQVSFLFASGRIKSLGRVSRCASHAWLVNSCATLGAAAFMALIAQSFARCFPAPLPSCLCELT